MPSVYHQNHVIKSSCKYVDKMNLIKVDVTNDGQIKEVKQQIKDYLEQNNQVLWSLINNAGKFAGKFFASLQMIN